MSQKTLNIHVATDYRDNKHHLRFKWDGQPGERYMKIDTLLNIVSIPREGVEEIKALCEEFLNGTDLSHKFLKLEKV